MHIFKVFNLRNFDITTIKITFSSPLKFSSCPFVIQSSFHHGLQATTDLLSVTRDYFSLSGIFNKWKPVCM